MRLFKYCNASGKFIVQNLEIKVTPPNELNDTCEMRPVVLTSDPNGWARSFIDKALSDPSFFTRNADAFPSHFKNFAEFQQSANEGRPWLTQLLAKAAPRLDNNLQSAILDMVSAKWGVVSLTDNPLNELMWAHYADSSKGIVVEFDETNALFVQPSFLKCSYSDAPVVYDPSIGENHKAVEEFARQKKMTWSYENESRLIIPLSECRSSMIDSRKIYLFKIEAQVVLSITFGLRTPGALKEEILAYLNRSELGHVKKWQVIEGASSYDLRLTQI